MPTELREAITPLARYTGPSLSCGEGVLRRECKDRIVDVVVVGIHRDVVSLHSEAEVGIMRQSIVQVIGKHPKALE